MKSKDECSQFVKNAGYDFTTQEFEQYTALLLELNSDNDGMTDLDEKELEAVFGGASSIDKKELEAVFGGVSPIFDFPIVQPMYGVFWPPIDIVPMYGIPVGDDLLKDDRNQGNKSSLIDKREDYLK